MDSVPILTIRYLPSMISPSFPYIGADFPSDRTAHFTPSARSRKPSSFNGIGGGGGGPVGTAGAGRAGVSVTIGVVTREGDGGATFG